MRLKRSNIEDKLKWKNSNGYLSAFVFFSQFIYYKSVFDSYLLLFTVRNSFSKKYIYLLSKLIIIVSKMIRNVFIVYVHTVHTEKKL